MHAFGFISRTLSHSHPRTVGLDRAMGGLESLFITLAPGPRGPMLYSAKVLVCVGLPTQAEMAGWEAVRAHWHTAHLFPRANIAGWTSPVGCGYEASPPVACGRTGRTGALCSGCGVAQFW